MTERFRLGALVVGIESESMIHLILNLRGIGEFGQHSETYGREFLQDTTALLQASAADAKRIVDQLRPAGAPDLHALVVGGEERALDARACVALLAFFDDLRKHVTPPSRIDISHGAHDEQVHISMCELGRLVGADQAQRLQRLYHSPIDKIIIRRVAAVAQHHLMAFHTDDTSSSKTMQVALNKEDEYEGGRLVFATVEGFLQPARPPGAYTIHHWYMPHGVTELRSGVRYSLFLMTLSQSVPTGPAE